MTGFAQVERRHRDMAIDMIEDARAGRAFANDAPPATGAAVRAMTMAPNADDSRIVAAAATALQEGWERTYGAGDVAMRMAGLVAFQAEAASRARHDRGVDTAREAAGSFASLPADRQDEIATSLNRSTAISATEASNVIDDAAAAARLGRTLPRDVARDQFETMRREIDKARHQLGIEAAEWRQPGERGRVSMLLHIQAPAMIAVAGGVPRVDSANAEAFAAQVAVMRERPARAIEGPGGIKPNLALARQLSNWLAPTLDRDVRELVAPEGSLHRLATELQKGASRQTGRTGQNAETGMGIAA